MMSKITWPNILNIAALILIAIMVLFLFQERNGCWYLLLSAVVLLVFANFGKIKNFSADIFGLGSFKAETNQAVSKELLKKLGDQIHQPDGIKSEESNPENFTEDEVQTLENALDEVMTKVYKTIETIPDEKIFVAARQADKAGDPSLAIDLYRQYLKRVETSSTAHNNLGVAILDFLYNSNHLPEKALFHFNQAIKFDPNNITALVNKGECSYSMGDYDAAMDCFDRVLQVKQLSNIYNYKGLIYEKLGDFERSFSCYKKANELAPDILLYRQNMAGALILNNKISRAKVIIEELENTIPSAWSAKTIGHIFLLEGKKNKAAEMYYTALNRLESKKEKFEFLKFIKDNDIPAGLKAYPDKVDNLIFLNQWVAKGYRSIVEG